MKGAVQMRVYYPQMSELITAWKPEEELTKEEKLAKEAGKKLRAIAKQALEKIRSDD